MRHKLHKQFWAWQWEEEEEWLNEMSEKGLQLVEVGLFTYWFEEGEKGAYQYRLELLKNLPKNVESQKYIAFLEDAGIEMVGSLMGWVYFRKKGSEGEFQLYSDAESKLRHLRRILLIFTPLGLANLLFMMNNFGLIFRFGSTAFGFDRAIFISMVPVIFLEVIIVVLFSIGAVKLLRKIRSLKKDHQLME